MNKPFINLDLLPWPNGDPVFKYPGTDGLKTKETKETIAGPYKLNLDINLNGSGKTFSNNPLINQSMNVLYTPEQFTDTRRLTTKRKE